jgi:hypothetical protein
MMALNDFYRRLNKAELEAARAWRPSQDGLEWWQKELRAMSADERNAFFDKVSNETRSLRKDT